MTTLVYLIPLLLLSIGVCYLASDSDLLWSRHRLQLRRQGITSVERTPEWEFSRKLSGYGCIVCALIILFLLVVASPSQHQSSAMRPVAGESSDFTLNGTPVSPEQMRELGLSVPDKNR